MQIPAGPATQKPAGSFESLHRALCILMLADYRPGLDPASCLSFERSLRLCLEKNYEKNEFRG